MKHSSRSPRLPSEERRQAIMDAARAVFCEKGCDAATTRELADAAGVSEALLYKHFPSKESLFHAICEDCAQTPVGREFTRLVAQKPSTKTLVGLVRLAVRELIVPATWGSHYRLFLRSLVEDGAFARQFLQKALDSGVVGQYTACLKAARLAGDTRTQAFCPELGFWFVHHFCVGLQATLLAHPPPLDYHRSQAELVEQATVFALSGLGLTDEALRRYPAD